MLALLALALSCGSVPDKAPDGVRLQPGAARAARLLAQAPPPVPMRGYEDAAERARQVEAELAVVNDELRALSTDWPVGALAMVWVGWLIAPTSVAGLLVWVVGAFTRTAAVATLGIILMVAGLVGVAVGIAGIILGVTSSSAAKAEKQQLELRRRQLQDELRALRGQAALGAFDGALVTVARF